MNDRLNVAVEKQQDVLAHALPQVPEFMADAKCLPATAYTDAEHFRSEMLSCFHKNWVSIGTASQVPEAGDMRTVDFHGQPLLITRDRAGEVHVVYNVCRHRGLRLVDADGVSRCKTGLLSCPYHKWGYGLDGRLRAAPYFDGTKTYQLSPEMKEKYGLINVRSAVWNDIIFVNLSGEAVDFDEYVAPLKKRWESFDFSLLRQTHTKTYEPKANWKLASENFLDTYHVPYVHTALGNADQMFPGLDFTYLSDEIFGFIMPQFDRMRDTLPEVPELFPGRAEQFDYALDLIYMYPNTLMMVTPSWFQVITLLPQAAGLTKELLSAYLVGDEILTEKWAQYRDESWAVFNNVNVEDVEILERLQAGRVTDQIDKCSYAPFWDQLSEALSRRVRRDLAQTDRRQP